MWTSGQRSLVQINISPRDRPALVTPQPSLHHHPVDKNVVSALFNPCLSNFGGYVWFFERTVSLRSILISPHPAPRWPFKRRSEQSRNLVLAKRPAHVPLLTLNRRNTRDWVIGNPAHPNCPIQTCLQTHQGSVGSGCGNALAQSFAQISVDGIRREFTQQPNFLDHKQAPQFPLGLLNVVRTRPRASCFQICFDRCFVRYVAEPHRWKAIFLVEHVHLRLAESIECLLLRDPSLPAMKFLVRVRVFDVPGFCIALDALPELVRPRVFYSTNSSHVRRSLLSSTIRASRAEQSRLSCALLAFLFGGAPFGECCRRRAAGPNPCGNVLGEEPWRGANADVGNTAKLFRSKCQRRP